MSISNKLKSAGAWQSAETVSTYFSQFLYMAIMARILDKEDFGLMAIVSSLVAFGNVLTEGGMGAALVQKKNVTDRHINAALQGSLILGILLYFCIALFAHNVAIFFDQERLEPLSKFIALNLFLLSISSVSIGLLQKTYKFKEKCLVSVVAVVFSGIIGIFLGLSGYGVWSLLVSSVVLALVKSVGFFYYANISILFGFFGREWFSLFRYGFGITLLKVNNFLSSQGIVLVLGKFFAPALLGVFERTYNIKTLPGLFVGAVLDSILFPAMSEMQDRHQEMFRAYQYSLGIVNTIFIPMAFVLSFFSEEIVLILLGGKWNEAVYPLQVMFWVLPFSSSGRMADILLRAKGLIYRNVFRKFLFVMVLITSAAVGAKHFGLTGAAFGVLFSFISDYFTMIFIVRRVFKKSIFEIFFEPILPGVRLLVLVGSIVFALYYCFNIVNFSRSLSFFCIIILLTMLMGFAIKIRPSIFGSYIEFVLLRMNNVKTGNAL